MSRPDFSRVWGSANAPFTSIEASDYAAGWVFRTGAPPRRVNFDYFQNLSDTRHEWLGGQMLLAVGHEWQSDVTYDQYAVTRSPVNGQLYRSLADGNIGNEPSVSGAKWALGISSTSDSLNTLRVNVASASNVNLTTAAPNTRHINITGTTTINGFTVAAGQVYFVRFADALTLTNGASLGTNRGANVAVAAGDTCIIRANAANVVEVMVGDYLSEAAVGTRGQTWQDVSASRLPATNYTNTTGRPIQVNVTRFTPASTVATCTLSVGGVVASSGYHTGQSRATLSAIVPAGAVYRVDGGDSTASWTELRT
jgi:hypothetical protein